MSNDGRKSDVLERDLWFAALPRCCEADCGALSAYMVGCNYLPVIYMCELHALAFARLHGHEFSQKAKGAGNVARGEGGQAPRK